MVYFANLSELRAHHQDWIGMLNYACTAQEPDARAAITMANLQPNERVLDLGCGGARVTAAAKRAVGGGLVVGLDGVQGFLDVDAAAHLRDHGFTVAPAGPTARQVHLVKGSVTDGAIRNLLANKTDHPAVYDVIFLLHIFETIPPSQRRQTLQSMKRMLAPGGRIIMNMSARFGNAGTMAIGDPQVPVQFRVGDFTEAPGAMLIASMEPENGTVQLPDGRTTVVRRPWFACQVSPDRFWGIAAQQAQAAAAHVGLRVVQQQNISKGSEQGLPPRTQSPPALELQNMTEAQLEERCRIMPGFHCWGRTCEHVAKLRNPGISQRPSATRDLQIVISLQQQVARIQFIAKGDAESQFDHTQVGVLVELRV
jgi:SAM-dependent methyltransferase